MSDAKGPYQLMRGGRIGGPWEWIKGPTDPHRCLEPIGEVVKALNDCHGVAYAAGRASRDGLREALVAISSELYVNVDAATRCRQLAKKALADDEEGK